VGWSDRTCAILLFGSAILPLIGIVAGIIAILGERTRRQGKLFLALSVGFAVMYIVATPVGGILFGLFWAILLVLLPRRKCQVCGLLLPRFASNRGGWANKTCPNCLTEVNPRGEPVK